MSKSPASQTVFVSVTPGGLGKLMSLGFASRVSDSAGLGRGRLDNLHF